MRRLTTSEFIDKAIEIHGDKYCYNNINYLGVRNKVNIICNEHGVFSQLPNNHLTQKQGCPKCFGNKKLTTSEFIEKAIKIHDNKYDYSKSKYYGNHKKLNIICNKHGVFTQAATRHLTGDGCPRCNGGVKLTKSEFIEKAIKIHGNKYDYSDFKYLNSKIKGVIICPKHGKFNITPNNHLTQKQGCSKCFGNKKLTTSEFIEKAIKIHGNKYDYSYVDYKSGSDEISIICDVHGIFKQKARNHLSGRGCKYCKQSKGEKFILNFLIKNNIEFVCQKSFDDCRNVLPLRFDFYVKEKNLLIEFDGDQHRKPNKFFGGKLGFIYRKNNYVKKKNILLLRITYNDFRSNRVEKLLLNNLINK